jgi:ATP-binding cassette subfamily C protein
MSSVRAFVRLLRDAPASRVVLLLAMMVLVGITEGIGILLLVPLLEVLQHHGGGNSSPVAHMLLTTMGRVGLSPSAGGLLLAFVVLVLVRNAIQHGRSVLGANLQYSLVDRLRYRCFSAVLGAQWRWIVAGRKSDHASLLLTDVSRVGLGLNFGLNLLANMATMLAYLASAFVLSWTANAAMHCGWDSGWGRPTACCTATCRRASRASSWPRSWATRGVISMYSRR